MAERPFWREFVRSTPMWLLFLGCFLWMGINCVTLLDDPRFADAGGFMRWSVGIVGWAWIGMACIGLLAEPVFLYLIRRQERQFSEEVEGFLRWRFPRREP